MQTYEVTFVDRLRELQKESLKRIQLLLNAGGCMNVCGNKELECLRGCEVVKEDLALLQKLKIIPHLSARTLNPYGDGQPSSGDEYVVD